MTRLPTVVTDLRSRPAGQIVRELVVEARQIISQRLAGLVAMGAGRVLPGTEE